ncbi:hypothetical protein AcW1_000261 [Taiwanofungus camphoratus]|nr:hypothetical protein AcW2_001242 [Antrodia cinnamomea]KAI0935860.1 hypothetical protein AcV5_004162 [Antrodia cinnamomea]KAI0961087.1 hypothetical protein AcV7_000282 [Antrodia cinnamomea]KAI0963077.1 hypothetical protein AcW1_000261 [Antrodia cinnamomea]
MFMSFCYWPPVPLESALAVPWSENVTTFADALLSVLPDLPGELKPADIPIVDRCWCEITTKGLFEPFNVTRWEVNSVLRLKEDLEKKMQTKNQEAEAEAGSQDGGAEIGVASQAQEKTSAAGLDKTVGESTTEVRTGIWNLFWPFSRKLDSRQNASSSSPTLSHIGLPINHTLSPPQDPSEHSSSDLDGANTSYVSSSLPGPTASQKLPLLRKEYDLHPYGFALIVDFGWTPSAS